MPCIKSVKAYIKHTIRISPIGDRRDIEINDMKSFGFEMIALTAGDHRLADVVTVAKASSDLERMADRAVSIAKSAAPVKVKPGFPMKSRFLI